VTDPRASGVSRKDGILVETAEASRGGLRRELNFARSVFVYRSLFDELGSPQALGLTEEDLLTAWPADEAVTVTYRMVGDHEVDLPLLVPIERLHWYNAEFFRELYGDGRPVQYYTHAPVAAGEGSKGDGAMAVIAGELERGTVIITDSYVTGDADDEFGAWAPLLERRGMRGVEVGTLRGGDEEGVLNQYVGNVDFDGVRAFAPASSCHEHFVEALPRGLLEVSVRNGIEVVETMTGREAERLWAIYEGPFDALSGGHVLRAGFDRRAFMDALGDPEVVKLVRRDRADITTLSLFAMNVRSCPWLNADYYEEHHRDAFRTGNIMVFTAMVSDENRRGSAYASALITAITEIMRTRGPSCLITFECNSISSQYIPRIVMDAIGQEGRSVVTGLETPVSSLAFKAISKAT
jgi:hypothetical protein